MKKLSMVVFLLIVLMSHLPKSNNAYRAKVNLIIYNLWAYRRRVGVFDKLYLGASGYFAK